MRVPFCVCWSRVYYSAWHGCFAFFLLHLLPTLQPYLPELLPVQLPILLLLCPPFLASTFVPQNIYSFLPCLPFMSDAYTILPVIYEVNTIASFVYIFIMFLIRICLTTLCNIQIYMGALWVVSYYFFTYDLIGLSFTHVSIIHYVQCMNIVVHTYMHCKALNQTLKSTVQRMGYSSNFNRICWHSPLGCLLCSLLKLAVVCYLSLNHPLQKLQPIPSSEILNTMSYSLKFDQISSGTLPDGNKPKGSLNLKQ